MIDMGLVGFRDFDGIGSSTPGDNKSWRMIACNRPPLAERGQPPPDTLPVMQTEWGQILCPLEKVWWGESEIHSPLA